jgi:hypothetical protein
MSIDPMVVDQFLGHPDLPDSTSVRVSGEIRRGFGSFDGKVIPCDNRSYILYGYTILADGRRIPSQFEIDTRKPTLLVGEGLWHIDGTWHMSFDPAVLKAMNVAPEEARPFRWIPNVPIQTVEQPPYLEGQVLHASAPPTPPGETARALSGEVVGGGDLASMSLEVGEKVRWSCGARSVKDATGSGRGALFLTTRRVLYCPNAHDRPSGLDPLALRIREVTDVGCQPIGDPQPAGGRKMGLRLILVGGRDEVFEVDGVIQAIEELSKVIHPID